MTEKGSSRAEEIGFARKASGLTRSVSPIDAMLIGVSGCGLGLLPIYLTWAYADITASIWQSLVLFMVLTLFIVFSYSLFTVLMPRSGGDYVFVGRTLSPGVGFVINWSGLVIWNTFWIAWNGFYLATFGLPMCLYTVGYSINSASLLSLAGSLTSSPWYTIAIGSVLIWGMLFLLLLPMKVYLSFQKILYVVLVLAVVVSLALFFSSSIGSFSSSFNHFVAPYTNATNPYQQVITDAQTTGLANTNPPFSFAAMISGMGIWGGVMLWMHYGTFLGGEIKNIKKSTLVAIPLGLVLMVVVAILWDLGMRHAMGSNFLNSVNYLYYNAPQLLPLQIPPMAFFLSALTTNNVILIWLVSMGVLLGNILACPVNTIGAGRCLFAYSMDKLMPEKVSSVNRFHSPNWATFLLTLAGFFWLFVYVFIPGLTAFSAALAACIELAAVTLALIVVPWRQKNLFEASSINWRIGKLPVVSLIGAIGLAASLLYMGLYLTNPVFGANSNTSLIAIGLSIASGIAIYFIAKAYRKREGIDISLLFKEVPPI